MIPSDWLPYRRSDDGEHVGYLRPEGDDVVPCTLLGTAVGEPMDWVQAFDLLDEIGLSYLADPWVLTHLGGIGHRVLIVEVDAERVVVTTADFGQAIGASQEQRQQWSVEVPVPAERLRPLS